MAMDFIRIRGARTHNLKNIDLDLPRDKLIVITGLSGSGKSSLAFDTIYAEGQRRYVESLSAYARQFLSVMEKPDLDHIEGLSPAISIEQKSTSHNPRSTVGTITEIYDYLRLLYARVGQPRCPDHGFPLEAQTVSQMVDHMLTLDPEQRYMLLAPVIRDRKGEHAQVFEQLRAQGFVRVRVDGELYEIDAVPPLALRQKHTIEAVIDRFRPREDIKQRLAESFGPRSSSAKAWLQCSRWTMPLLRRICSRPSTAARCAITRCRSWNRACSRSMRRSVPARAAMAWAWPNSSTRTAWWCIRSCRCRPAQCVAGIGAMPIISS